MPHTEREKRGSERNVRCAWVPFREDKAPPGERLKKELSKNFRRGILGRGQNDQKGTDFFFGGPQAVRRGRPIAAKSRNSRAYIQGSPIQNLTHEDPREEREGVREICALIGGKKVVINCVF